VAASDNLRVNPSVMQGFSQALRGGAEDLRTRLADLDGQVSEMLTGWRGKSGGAFTAAVGAVASRRRRGAGGVVDLGKVGIPSRPDYQENEAASSQALRGVCHG
jgi:uncharacterized protein YukE